MPLESISMKLVVLTAAGSARHGSLVQIILCSEKIWWASNLVIVAKTPYLAIRSLNQNDITSMPGCRLAQGNVRKYKNCEFDQLPASHV